MALVARSDRLAATLLPDADRQRLAATLAARWPEATLDRRLMPSLAAALADYFAGRAARFDVDIDLDRRTPFQRDVLEACRRIPPGEVVTYGQLAAQVGRPRAARAVGQTMAANPVPLVVPCHRVVAADGSLCGFSAAGGLDAKRRLLDHERRFWGSKELEGGPVPRGILHEGQG
ncbi:MAG TPA: methylated-DNA--[protein]-cysteine S-methyltransferase [Phycisphaerae bacterium]|nr:methylated-DNA--[protein]-cysteine S-methyltransferase [Phycisphaerae bacterium]HOI56440.1 methylated-DNA--[protein]-cysteine S-methyltransferase [Phycisphaerae bacterium]